MLLPHRLEIKASRYLAAMLVLFHLVALLSLLPVPLPSWLKTVLGLSLIWVGVIALRQHALQLDGASICEIRLRNDGTLEALRRDGVRFEATVGRHSTVLPWLVVMLLDRAANSRSDARHAVILLRDALAAEDYRLLLTWMRWKTT